ncbi:hypothetical protein MOQ_004093 [Trypanosoma cruzi marinkellei]|uniref:Kringle domain-containing protein n=1 Tax=Trypanosoma cruzi marinkellei TaxID=85056 RepID=K2MYD2_TRYCR|nr:hypothetical protein MOQ_004093 [Trypanosoma cruzi marinkellei]
MLRDFHAIILFSLLVWLAGDVGVVHGSTTCDPVEGYYLPNGEDYRGHVNFTEMGISCQKWNEQQPHRHDTHVPDSLTGVGNHNYCRNPSGLERPGCFTMNPSIRYQFCDVGLPCRWTPPETVLQFEPSSGTELRADQPVKITCYPRPCEIYYTLDGSVPTTSSGIFYFRPIVLSRNTTVNALALFASKKTLQRQAFYSTLPRPAPSGAYFIPLPPEVSQGPVLLFLKGLRDNDTALIFKNEDLRGFPYEGPFWLNESTNVTAVINGEHLVRASYVFMTTGVTLEMYPASGKYIGGVSCLVYQSDSQANNTISINGLSWQPLSEFVFILDTVGINVVGVRSISLGGVMNAVWRKYEIVESIPPVLLPAPDVVYTEPIRVTCKDPMGRALAVDKKDDELIYSIRLDIPGRFSVNCTYLDDLHHTRSAHAVYEVKPIPLPMPLLRPECGRSFPMISLLLVTTIVPPPDTGCERDPRRLGLNASSTGATLQEISGNGSFLLKPTQTDAINVTVTVSTHSSSPLEADSPPRTCRYEMLPLGLSVTPWFVGRIGYENRSGCFDLLLRQLSKCLSFGTTELIFIQTIGPFVMIQLQRLPTSLRMEYYTRTGDCLPDKMLTDVRNETSGLIQLARWWAANRTSSSLDFVTGVGITIVVKGWGLDSGEFHLVREEFPCNDIGVSYSTRNSLDLFSLQLLFVIDTPGSYKLCASLNDALYVVPSNGTLIVNSSRLPVLLPAPCGGRSEGPVDVVLDMASQGVNPYLFVSIDNGFWYRVEARTAVHVANLTPSVTSATLALTAGQRSVASEVCVFYRPQGEMPRKATYKWAVAFTYEGRSNILLSVNGSFSGESRVELRAYGPWKGEANDSVSTVNETALQRSVSDIPFFVSLGTFMGSFTVADSFLTLVGAADEYPVSIVVSVDGTSMDAEPLNVALSPLAIAMHSCKNCISGWCFGDQCVCIGETNHTAYLCVENPLSPTNPESGASRSKLLMVYLLLLAVVFLFVGVAIYHGTKRGVPKPESEGGVARP